MTDNLPEQLRGHVSTDDKTVMLCREAADRIDAQDEELSIAWHMADEAVKKYEQQCQKVIDLEARVFELENDRPLEEQLNS